MKESAASAKWTSNGAKPMSYTLTYEMTPALRKTLYRSYFRHAYFNWKGLLLIATVFIGGTVGAVFSTSEFFRGLGMGIIFLGLLLCFAWGSLYRFGIKMEEATEKGERTLTLSDEGVTIAYGKTTIHTEWHKVAKVIETPASLILAGKVCPLSLLPIQVFSPEHIDYIKNMARAKS